MNRRVCRKRLIIEATPEDFAERVKADIESYRKLVDDGVVKFE